VTSSSEFEELVRHLMEHRPELAARVTDAAFADPFWTERFPTRGRRFAEEDAQYHVGYLCQALVAGDPGVLDRYVGWLRGVLTARGMCTRHLQENLETLAAVVGDEAVTGSDEAARWLRAAAATLSYGATAAGELEVALARPGDGRERQHLVSYVADAVASERPDLFVAHVRWLASAARVRGAGARPLTEVLASLLDDVSTSATLAPGARALGAEVLERASAALLWPARSEASA
jgi:hypothetical protein